MTLPALLPTYPSGQTAGAFIHSDLNFIYQALFNNPGMPSNLPAYPPGQMIAPFLHSDLNFIYQAILANASAKVVVGTIEGQITYWDTSSGEYLPSTNVLYDHTNQGFLIGTSSSLGSGSKLFVATSPPSTVNYATVSIGSAPFDGSSSGKFVGSSSGTSFGINEASGYAGNLVDFQINGSSMFKLSHSGNINFGGDLTFLEAKNIVIGTTTGTQIGTTTSQMLGFLGATPVAQQTGGAATAGPVYSATEQIMLQAAYNCLRTFGFLS